MSLYHDIHFDNDYFVTIKTDKTNTVCIVKFPENIFQEAFATELMYEIEDEKVTVYKDREKLLSQNCPNYAKRMFIWLDILKRMDKTGISTELIRAYDKDEVQMESHILDTATILAILKPPDDSERPLEDKLIKSAIAYANKDVLAIPEDILDGYQVCEKNYRKEV